MELDEESRQNVQSYSLEIIFIAPRNISKTPRQFFPV